MGKVLSVAAGKLQRYNVENRAQRVIAQDKPKPAPKFDSNIKELERILRGENHELKSSEEPKSSEGIHL
jgi:NADH dehydrogenase [ubiquinone] 1 alpha subcomplex assembly factor 4